MEAGLGYWRGCGRRPLGGGRSTMWRCPKLFSRSPTHICGLHILDDESHTNVSWKIYAWKTTCGTLRALNNFSMSILFHHHPTYTTIFHYRYWLAVNEEKNKNKNMVRGFGLTVMFLFSHIHRRNESREVVPTNRIFVKRISSNMKIIIKSLFWLQ